MMNGCLYDINDNVTNIKNLQCMQKNDFIAKDMKSLEIRDVEEVELQITNLDRSIPTNQLRDTLLNLFKMESVEVIDLTISFLLDGNPQAIVKLENQEIARHAISRLQRKKLGHKRIYISQRTKSRLCSLKSKVVSVLMNIPGGRISLLKFRELYEKRFNSSVKIPDLNQMKEVLVIQEDSTGRVLQLNPNYEHLESLPGLELLFCEKHSSPGVLGDTDFGKRPLMLVEMPLSELSARIKHLLKEHQGRIPMSSITDCYKHYYGDPVESGDNAVPLLHLITCVRGSRVITDETGTKSLVDNNMQSTPLVQQVDVKETQSVRLANQFSREVVDLLKTWPGCRMPFSEFIPAFHHFFGRQCRVADYGYTKLRDLFEAMPHIVHVLGEGSKAIITLSIRAQIKRFTTDVVRVLKYQPDKQVLLSDFPDVFETHMNKGFKISDYGVCRMEDMLDLLPDNTLTFIRTNEKNVPGISKLGTGSNLLISLPRRDNSFQTVDRTQQFAKEVVDLLKHSPDCSINFNKFIPAFHHHFGVQCRVSDYGYEKLMDLFEAIPKIVDISEDVDGEKLVQLTQIERMKVIGEQLQKLVEGRNGEGLPISQVFEDFKLEYGYQLYPAMFKLETIHQLVDMLPDWIRIVSKDCQEFLQVSEEGFIQSLKSKVAEVLYSDEHQWVDYPTFQLNLFKISKSYLTFEDLQDKFSDILDFQGDKIRLTYKTWITMNIEILLQEGRLTLPQLCTDYEARFKRKLNYADLGYSDLLTLASDLPSLSIRGQGLKLTVGLQERRDSSAVSKLCKSKIVEKSANKRFALNSPSPEKTLIPPNPPDNWIKGSHQPSKYFRNCPTPPPPFGNMSTPPPAILNPCTPPPPPVNWKTVVPTPVGMCNWSVVGTLSPQGYISAPNNLPGFNASTATFTSSTYKPAQPFEPMTPSPSPRSASRMGYPYQYQMSPLSRPPPPGCTQFFQYNTVKPADPFQNNTAYQNSGFLYQTEIDRFQADNPQSLFSHAFSIPTRPRSSAPHTFAIPIPPRNTPSPVFQFQGMSPGFAGSPVSPGLSADLFHVPPINTNSPPTGLGDYSVLKMFGGDRNGDGAQ